MLRERSARGFKERVEVIGNDVDLMLKLSEICQLEAKKINVSFPAIVGLLVSLGFITYQSITNANMENIQDVIMGVAMLTPAIVGFVCTINNQSDKNQWQIEGDYWEKRYHEAIIIK